MSIYFLKRAGSLHDLVLVTQCSNHPVGCFLKTAFLCILHVRECGCSSSTLSGCFQDFLKYQHPLLLASLINMVFQTQLLRSCSVHRKWRCCFLRYSWNFYFVSLHFIFFFTPQLGGPVNTALLVSVSEWTFKLMHEKECMNEGVRVFVTELRKRSCP